MREAREREKKLSEMSETKELLKAKAQKNMQEKNMRKSESKVQVTGIKQGEREARDDG